MVELNCETDFVARNKNFVSLLQHVTELNLKAANVTELDKVCTITNYLGLLQQAKGFWIKKKSFEFDAVQGPR